MPSVSQFGSLTPAAVGETRYVCPAREIEAFMFSDGLSMSGMKIRGLDPSRVGMTGACFNASDQAAYFSSGCMCFKSSGCPQRAAGGGTPAEERLLVHGLWLHVPNPRK